MEAAEQPTVSRETEAEAHQESDDETTLQINEQIEEQQQNEPTGSAPVEEVEGPREQGAVEPERDEKEHQMKTLLSLSHKIAFMKVFEAAPKMRDIFGALRAFMTNSEVLDDERKEVQALFEKRVQDEKASRKASKEKTVDPSSGAMDPANAIKNVAGIDLTALFPPKPAPAPVQPVVQNIPNQQGSSGAFVKFDEPPPIYAAQMSGPGPNSMPPMIPPVAVPYGVPTMNAPMGHAPVMSTSIGYPGDKPLVTARILADKRRPNHYGKLGMNLSHSKEIPSVPEELLAERNKVIPPVPPELQLDYVPPVPGAEPPEPVHQPKRLTLILSGARPRRLWLRKPEDENKAPNLPKEMDFEDETSVDKINSLLPPGVPPLSAALVKMKKSGASEIELRRKMVDTAREFRKDVDTLRRARREELRGANASKSTFHKNTPLAVKRYHARQFAKIKYNYKFVPPYRVLVDGTFCNAALQEKLNLAEQIPKYLTEETHITTTNCVLKELENFGPLLYGAHVIAKQFKLAVCNHNPPKAASDCLAHLARRAASGKVKYLVATQDEELTEKLRSIVGTPIMFIKYKTVLLDNISEATKNGCNSAKADIEQLKMLKKELIPKNEIVKRKKKKIKGANPLSCKRKIMKVTDSNERTGERTSSGKRKRTKKKAATQKPEIES